jgi:hypothetical protein
MRKKAIMRREQDPTYGWLQVDPYDLRPDQKLSKLFFASHNADLLIEMRRMRMISLYNKNEGRCDQEAETSKARIG